MRDRNELQQMVKDLQEQNMRLFERIDVLENTHEELIQQNKSLIWECEVLRQENTRLNFEVQELRQENAMLK